MTLKEWAKYRDLMSQICRKASDEFRDFALQREGGIGGLDRQTVLEYAYALVQKYGQASGELACMFYEQIAEAQNVIIPPAEMAALPEFGEVAKAVNGAIKQTEKNAPGVVERLTKQVGADTMLQNAKRDGAHFAWITAGDTCAYCMMMSAIGWQKAGKNTLRGNHAEHIHAHCDCQYVVDFKGDLKVKGYDPEGLQKDIMQITGSDSGDFNAFLNANGRQSMKPSRNGLKVLRRHIEEQNRQLSFDLSDSQTRIRVSEFVAFKANESKYGIYVSENANKKTQNLSNIEKSLDKALEKLEISETGNLPMIFVLNQEEMGVKAFASYNAVKNELYLSDSNGNKQKTIDIQKALGFADANHADSTVRHELIHWMDAEEYKKSGTIRNTEEYKKFLQDLSERCRIELEKEGITANNIDTVSGYAAESYARKKYDEAYTEYRVLLSGGVQDVRRN